MFCEPYIERGHHIEVQILADAHGGEWAVGERECSIQRRHQKVVEEAPAPLVERVGGDLRERLFTAARDAAKAIDYVGAGTVEFLADEQGRFYFLETNTRLQVEHPVTELTTGTDLVEWQVRVADGEAWMLPNPVSSGHAIEVRLYAEDPPLTGSHQSGAVHSVAIAADSEFAGLARPGIRVDAGIESGSVISTFYDPMLAKVISWAPRSAQGRRDACAGAVGRDAARAGHQPRPAGEHPADKDFLDGHTDTGFLDASADGYAALVEPRPVRSRCALPLWLRRWLMRLRTGRRQECRPGCPAGGGIWLPVIRRRSMWPWVIRTRSSFGIGSGVADMSCRIIPTFRSSGRTR